MSQRVDLYNSTYGNFESQILAEIRRKTYGKDIGQNSWITAEEYDSFYNWLELPANTHKLRVLEVASGSGGPALHLAQKQACEITGIDINEDGLTRARQAALKAKLTNAKFQFADMDKRLPFEEMSFDAVLCMDSMNHFSDRCGVLKEWYRILKPGRRVVFTDPVVITGAISNKELAARSSIGFFLFVPLVETKRLIKEAGFHLLRCEDVTENIELTSGRWYDARQQHKNELLQIEGEERFEGLQQFAKTVHQVTRERRLSRFVFLAEKK